MMNFKEYEIGAHKAIFKQLSPNRLIQKEQPIS